MTSARRLPTSADVARVAGVSRSTVSLVLNDTTGTRFPAATRAKVLAAAADLGYVVNRAAADLRRGASRTVLAVLDQSRVDSTVVEFLPALSEALAGAKLNLVTTVASGDVGIREAHALVAMRPVAILAMGVRMTPPARAFIAATGCVTIGDPDADIVMSIDQGAVATTGVKAMHDRGRYRLLQILAREESLGNLTRARVAAFDAAAGSRGLGTIHVGLHPDEARELVATMRDWPVMPDGIVASNDEYATLVLGALLDAGMAVPGDVAVLGSDNTSWGLWMRPALSTIVLEPGDITDQLVAALDSIRQGRPYPDVAAARRAHARDPPPDDMSWSCPVSRRMWPSMRVVRPGHDRVAGNRRPGAPRPYQTAVPAG